MTTKPVISTRTWQQNCLCHTVTAQLTVLVCCAACEAVELGLTGSFWGRRSFLPQLQCALSVCRPTRPACVRWLIWRDCNMASLRISDFDFFLGVWQSDKACFQTGQGVGSSVACVFLVTGRHTYGNIVQNLLSGWWSAPLSDKGVTSPVPQWPDAVIRWWWNGWKMILRAYCYAQKKSDN